MIGTMDFFATETLDLSQERMEALRSVGRLVSTAVQNLRIAERATTVAADAQAVTTVIQKMADCRTADEALRAALDTVREVFGWAYGSYWHLDSKENG